eukprot:3824746-Rhodomonas_salina.1
MAVTPARVTFFTRWRERKQAARAVGGARPPSYYLKIIPTNMPAIKLWRNQYDARCPPNMTATITGVKLLTPKQLDLKFPSGFVESTHYPAVVTRGKAALGSKKDRYHFHPTDSEGNVRRRHHYEVEFTLRAFRKDVKKGPGFALFCDQCQCTRD